MKLKLPKSNKRYELLSHFGPMNIAPISKIQEESSTIMLKIEHGVICHSSLGSILDNLISSFEDYVDKSEEENVPWFIPNIENAKIYSIQEYKRKEAVTIYFIQKDQPKIIARKLKIPVEMIYRDIEQVKKQVLKAIDFDTDKTQSKHKDSNDVAE